MCTDDWRGKFVQFALSNFAAFEVAEIVMTCHQNNWVRPTLYQGKLFEVDFQCSNAAKYSIERDATLQPNLSLCSRYIETHIEYHG